MVFPTLRGDPECAATLMSDQEPIAPKPLVLRVEISAEQAASIAPLLGGRSDDVAAPVSEETVDVRVLELRRQESDLERRERDLVSYVDQLQGAMSGGDDAWWSRPAGGDGGVR